MSEWMNERMSEWMNELVNECMKEGRKESINECMNQYMKEFILKMSMDQQKTPDLMSLNYLNFPLEYNTKRACDNY